jgi:hypothetical protein
VPAFGLAWLADLPPACRASDDELIWLRPELRRTGGIGGMRPHLCRLAILGMDHVDKLELNLLTGPLGADRDEHDCVIVADQDVMHLRLDGASSQLGDLAKLPDYLLGALIVAGERAGSGDMPDDVLGEELVM